MPAKKMTRSRVGAIPDYRVVVVKCPACVGSGLRPGVSLAELMRDRSEKLDAAIAARRCPTCKGKGTIEIDSHAGR